jgi:hypothetical protein
MNGARDDPQERRRHINDTADFRSRRPDSYRRQMQDGPPPPPTPYQERDSDTVNR